MCRVGGYRDGVDVRGVGVGWSACVRGWGMERMKFQ